MQKKHRPSIAAVIITYNEEENIEICLESIKWVDEVILVDSFSTDKTVEIAQKYTDNIFFRKFRGSFSSQRNFGLKHVSSDWVLILDADEKLQDKTVSKIRKLILQKDISGYWFPRRNYISKNKFLKYGIFYPDYQLRLIRYNKSIKYVGRIHEQPIVNKDKTRLIKSIRIIHNNSHTKYDKISSFYRFFPYIEIESKQLVRSKKTFSYLLKEGIVSIPKWIKISVFDEKGYLDGFNGIGAAFIYGLYRSITYNYSIYKRLIKVK